MESEYRKRLGIVYRILNLFGYSDLHHESRVYRMTSGPVDKTRDWSVKPEKNPLNAPKSDNVHLLRPKTIDDKVDGKDSSEKQA